MRLRQLFPVAAVIATLVLAGAGCYSRSTSTTPTTTASQNTVSINNFAFSPTSISVKVGTEVTWTNNDSTTHTVTGTNGGPASSDVAPGGTYKYTFATVGTYSYKCAIHPSMTGTVTVTQ